MQPLSLDSLTSAFSDALGLWREATGLTCEQLCRVDPRRGFPQADKRLTGFAVSLFAELVPPACEGAEAYVTFRGIPATDQQTLRDRIVPRHPCLTIIPKEHLSLDFALVTRPNCASLYEIGIAMESEMWPLSAKGDDPEKLCADFAKLCKIHAQSKIFLCRVTRGREKVGGVYRKKRDRFRTSMQSAARSVNLCQRQPAKFGIYMIETGPTAPWILHVITTEDDRELQLDKGGIVPTP